MQQYRHSLFASESIQHSDTTENPALVFTLPHVCIWMGTSIERSSFASKILMRSGRERLPQVPALVESAAQKEWFPSKAPEAASQSPLGCALIAALSY